MTSSDLPVGMTAIFGYRSDEYETARAAMADGHKLPRTYHEWRMSAEQGLKQLRRSGHAVVIIEVQLAEFFAWCAAGGLNVDAQARTKFAALKAREKLPDGRSHGHA